MSFSDILTGVKHAVACTTKFIFENRSDIEFFVGASLSMGSSLIFIHDAEEIASCSQKVKALKEEIDLVDKDPEGWSAMGESRNSYISKKKREIAIDYVKAAGPGVLMLASGEVLQGISKHTDKENLQSVSAALASVSMIFSQYRQRNIADQGEEKDYEYLTGQKISHTEVIDSETGEVSTITETTGNISKVFHGFIFDRHNPNYTGDPTVDLDKLYNHLVSVNRALKYEPFITGNDICHRYFGAEPTIEGNNWVAIGNYNDGDPNKPIARKLRINPMGIVNMTNGVRSDAVIMFEYDDGTPLEDNAPAALKSIGIKKAYEIKGE